MSHGAEYINNISPQIRNHVSVIVNDLYDALRSHEVNTSFIYQTLERANSIGAMKGVVYMFENSELYSNNTLEGMILSRAEQSEQSKLTQMITRGDTYWGKYRLDDTMIDIADHQKHVVSYKIAKKIANILQHDKPKYSDVHALVHTGMAICLKQQMSDCYTYFFGPYSLIDAIADKFPEGSVIEDYNQSDTLYTCVSSDETDTPRSNQKYGDNNISETAVDSFSTGSGKSKLEALYNRTSLPDDFSITTTTSFFNLLNNTSVIETIGDHLGHTNLVIKMHQANTSCNYHQDIIDLFAGDTALEQYTDQMDKAVESQYYTNQIGNRMVNRDGNERPITRVISLSS